MLCTVQLTAWEAQQASRLGIHLDDPLPQLAMNAVAFGTVLAFGWVLLRLDRAPIATMGLPWSRGVDRARPVLVGTAIGALWLLATVLGAWLAGGVELAPGRAPFPSAPTVAITVVSVTINAARQEIFCRGYPWFALESRIGPRAALATSSVLFVLMHPMAMRAPVAILNLLLVGLLFGLIRQRSGDLWMVTAAHAAWNILLGPLLGLVVSSHDLRMAGWRLLRMAGPEWLSGGPFGLEGSLVTTASTSLAVYLVWRRLAASLPPGRTPEPAGRVPS